jgi:PAS domain S-box-containing protein
MILRLLARDYFRNEEKDLTYNLIDFLNKLYDSITYQDLNNRVIWANETALEAMGLSLNKVMGEYCYKAFYGRNFPCEDCAVIKAQSTGEMEESTITLDNGKMFLVKGYPIKNHNAEVIGVIEISLDITKRKELQEKVENNKFQKDFLANLSHEFKTPLNLIFSALQILDFHQEDKLQLKDEKLEKNINIIRQNSYRLLKLVKNLIDITKVNSGYLNLNLKDCDIVKLIKDIVYSISDYINEKNRNLKFNFEVEELIIACDPFKIERIMLNLLSNAIKFTNEDDEILVSIYQNNEKSICISVKDTGIGIKKEKQKIIFERFKLAEKSFEKNSEGSGIGLSLVKSLVELHDGEIHLESEYGKGSEFIIELPIRVLAEGNIEKAEIKKNIRDKINIEFSDQYDIFSLN